MQTADKRTRLFDPGAGRGSFWAARRAFYWLLTAGRVASATCFTRAGFIESHSVGIADGPQFRLTDRTFSPINHRDGFNQATQGLISR
jgi:hypothetical protein